MGGIAPLELILIAAIGILLLGAGPALRLSPAAMPGLAGGLGSARGIGLVMAAGALTGLAYIPLLFLLEGSPERLLEIPLRFYLRAPFTGAISWGLAAVALRGLNGAPFPGQLFLAWAITPVLEGWIFYLLGNRFTWSGLTHIYVEYPHAVLHLAESVLLTVLVRRGGPAAEISSGGYVGAPMSNGESQTTRYLAAAAYAGTDNMGTRVLEWLDNRGRAVPPEVGVDLGLVAWIAQATEGRTQGYQWAFFGLGVAALLAVGAESPGFLLLVVLAATALWLQKDYADRAVLMRDFSRTGFSVAKLEERYARQLPPEHASAIPKADANLTVYSGFTPFVGAGLDVGGWSFAVALDKAKAAGVPIQPVSLTDTYAAVSMAVSRLGLPGLTLRDQYFVHGRDVRGDRELLPDPYGRPQQRLGVETASRILAASDARIRHYKWIVVEDWGGEIAFSYFLRCSLRGPSLFVEVKRFLLTPLRTSLKSVDNIAPMTLMQTASHVLVVAPVAAMFRMAFAPFSVMGMLNKAWEGIWGGQERRRRKIINTNPLYDFGAASSIRQTAASGDYQHYFQRADSDYYLKMLEKEILDTLVEFLDAHNVDTSDIKERQSTILNNGVIVQGGNINAGSLAVGDGAKAVQSRMKSAVSKAKAAAGGGA